MRILHNNHGFIGYLELLAVAVIIGFLMLVLLKRFTTAPVMNKETKNVMSEQGIDTTNYKTIVDTTRSAVNDISKQEAQRLEQLINSSTGSAIPSQ